MKKKVNRKAYDRTVNGKNVHVPEGTTTVDAKDTKFQQLVSPPPKKSIQDIATDNSAAYLLVETPAPQANSLPQLAATVDAIALGIDTKDEIAESLGGYHARQGDYYATAAEDLGLAYPLDNTSPRIWVLTEEGQRFSSSTPSERVKLLEDALVDNHWIDLYVKGEEELHQGLVANGYTGATLRRRIDCIKNWSHFLFDLTAQ